MNSEERLARDFPVSQLEEVGIARQLMAAPLDDTGFDFLNEAIHVANSNNQRAWESIRNRWPREEEFVYPTVRQRKNVMNMGYKMWDHTVQVHNQLRVDKLRRKQELGVTGCFGVSGPNGSCLRSLCPVLLEAFPGKHTDNWQRFSRGTYQSKVCLATDPDALALEQFVLANEYRLTGDMCPPARPPMPKRDPEPEPEPETEAEAEAAKAKAAAAGADPAAKPKEGEEPEVKKPKTKRKVTQEEYDAYVEKKREAKAKAAEREALKAAEAKKEAERIAAIIAKSRYTALNARVSHCMTRQFYLDWQRYNTGNKYHSY